MTLWKANHVSDFTEGVSDQASGYPVAEIVKSLRLQDRGGCFQHMTCWGNVTFGWN